MPRILLSNGCSFTEPCIFPPNWNSVKATVKKPWYINYRFHDPQHSSQFPKGKLISIRGIMIREWQYEVKWDGYRMLAYAEKGKAELQSRNNNDTPNAMNKITFYYFFFQYSGCVHPGQTIPFNFRKKHISWRIKKYLYFIKPLDVRQMS